jgi:sarcosine oxidase subunit beta
MRVDDTEGALYGPCDGYLDGHLYCTLLYERLSERGVRVLPKARIEGAEHLEGGAMRVHTPRGSLAADFVVNAAGAWAPGVAELLGTTVPIRPERHQAVIARLPGALPYTMPCVMTYSPGSGKQGVFFRHERPAHLVVGMHSLDPIGEVVDPDDYRRSNDQEFLEEVAEHLIERVPSFEHAALGDGWAGIYPMSPDGLPIVGPSIEHPNIIQANGAGGAGIMLSPVIGRVAAEWIVDGAVSCISEPDAIAPDRLMTVVAAASGITS